jgi:cell division cycle 20-like protein 1 (cofactor of APC complex)
VSACIAPRSHAPSDTRSFIPNRSGQDLTASFNLLHDEASPATPSKSKRTPHNELHFQKSKQRRSPLCDSTDMPIAEEANRTYSAVLRQEMFEGSVPQTFAQSRSPSDSANMRISGRSNTPPVRAAPAMPAPSLTPLTPHKNLFSYSGQPTPSRTPSSRHGVLNFNASSELYSLSPIKYSSQRMLLSPQRVPRAVAKVPYKVLDAPDLADDFYLNLVDWGSQNTLGVGLGSCVYMWNSASGRVTKLCDLAEDTITSVNWIQRVSCRSRPKIILLINSRDHTSRLAPTEARCRFGMPRPSVASGP